MGEVFWLNSKWCRYLGTRRSHIIGLGPSFRPLKHRSNVQVTPPWSDMIEQSRDLQSSFGGVVELSCQCIANAGYLDTCLL